MAIRFGLLSSFILGFALIAGAQERAPTSPAVDGASALSKLDFMVGTWKGAGWMMLGPGKRAEFTQTEVVTKKLSGALITIEGDGRDAGNAERHVHDAFATLYFLPESGEIHFTAFSGGNRLDVVPVIGEKMFQWGFDAPYGKTRFTLDYTTGQWHETGELSRDGGKTWMKNFEMTLTRS